jgi:hypothetical protein
MALLRPAPRNGQALRTGQKTKYCDIKGQQGGPIASYNSHRSLFCNALGWSYFF